MIGNFGQGPAVIELVSQAGFSRDYPIGRTPQGDLLRPLKQPLYDTENYPAAGTPNEVIFYQRPQGQTTAFAPATNKTAAETNLTLAGQISTPQHYKIYGFTFEVAPGTVLADFRLLYNTSVWEFTFTGNRLYLQVPLTRIPCGVAPEGFAATTVAATTLNETHNGVGHHRNIYDFALGRATLHIQPTETFGIRVRWPNGGVTPSAAVRMRTYILGVQFTAI